MKIAFTTVSHFIGRSLIEKLVRTHHQVNLLVPYEFDIFPIGKDFLPLHLKNHITVIRGHLNDANAVSNLIKEVDIVFHFTSADTFPNKTSSIQPFLKNEVCGIQVLLEQMERNDSEKRIIYVSTGDVYGEAKVIPIPEKVRPSPLTPHLAISIAAENLVLGYQVSGRVNATIVRLFNPYGPGQSSQAIIPTIIEQVLLQPNVLLGNMHTVRDFVYVNDIIDALLNIISKCNSIGEIMNIGSGKGIIIGTLAEKIMQISGVNRDILFDANRIRTDSKDIPKLVADISKAKRLLDWTPRITLVEGLSKTVNWFSRRLNWNH